MSVEVENLSSTLPGYFQKERLLLYKFRFFQFARRIFSNSAEKSLQITDNHLRRDIGLPELDRQERRFMVYEKDLPSGDFRRLW